MRIAQLAPLFESVPPEGYGGTERVVSYLSDALQANGHSVTLFASADSRTAAELCAGAPRALRLDPHRGDAVAMHLVMLERAFDRAAEFDVIHAHLDYLSFPMARRCEVPVVTTLHGRLDLPWLAPVFREFTEQRVVSISAAQRRPLPDANWVGTVHHGLPRDLYHFHPDPHGYLAFIGRISSEKRVDRAIEIAVRAGVPLRIAAKVDPSDEEYFRANVAPLLDHPLVDYVGELDDARKDDFIGNADALLFPIDWPEPFGLAMIEALACGTPVIAWPRGSVPEVLENGVSGWIVGDIASAVRAVGAIGRIDRRRCRAEFEARFTAKRMAADYTEIYAAAICNRGSAGSEPAVRCTA
ncbi:MAG TPA: glycosyltransferase family 4 protein [Myxococcota bacterium]|nr:glycosyltransferase family 4 protein [Myxococcota bacterium]